MPGQTLRSSHLRLELQIHFPPANSLVAVDADRGISRPLIADDKACGAIGPEQFNRHLSIYRPANDPWPQQQITIAAARIRCGRREAVDAQNSFEYAPDDNPVFGSFAIWTPRNRDVRFMGMD
jgi:hypothetical protein